MPKVSIATSVFVFFLAWWECAPAHSATPPQKPYFRYEIVQARYSSDEVVRKALQNAQNFKSEVDEVLIGQGDATAAVEARVLSYLNSYGTRTRDPISINLAGLYGLGKSALTHQLKRLGVEVLHIDVQKYLGPYTSLSQDLYYRFGYKYQPTGPFILILDEIDKVANQAPGTDAFKAGQAFLGELAEILSDGTVSFGSKKIELSNAFVATCMNLSQQLVEGWLKSNSAKRKAKTFWQMTPNDFEKYHAWVISKNGKPEVLSKTFPPQIVGRVSTNTVFLKPLTQSDYHTIVDLNIANAVTQASEGENEGRRLQITVDKTFKDFLYQNSIYAPSGARHTVYSVGNLMSQLIAYGTHVSSGKKASQSQPREIALGYDARSKKVRLKVTPLVGWGGQTKRLESSRFLLPFNAATNTISPPPDLVLTAPEIVPNERINRVTNAVVKGWRKPATKFPRGSLSADVESLVVGQDELLTTIEGDLNHYVSDGDKTNEKGHKRVVVGFTGNGKSSAVSLLLSQAEIPYVVLNMQSFHSDPEGFVKTLRDKVAEMHFPYAVVLEEGDKVPENQVDPGTGKIVTIQPPPAIAGIFKELLGSKQITYSTSALNERGPIYVDLRNAYIVATMNFGGNTFKFKPDPRLTTFDHVRKAWIDLHNPVMLKGILGTLFLPDFINRISAYLTLSNPLNEEDHQKIIDLAIAQVAESYLGGPGSSAEENPSRIELELSPQYREYLFQESVIPSEAGRTTFSLTENQLTRDVARARDELKASGPEATNPLKITLDYEGKETYGIVTATVSNLKKPALPARLLFRDAIALQFPSLERKGPLDASRLQVSVEQFGNALTRTLYSSRFRKVVVENIDPSEPGFVDAPPPLAGNKLIVEILSVLGGRAMERLLYADASPVSVRSTSVGAKDDLKKATKYLYGYLFELGQAPQAGIGSRAGNTPCGQFANSTQDVRYGNLTAEQGQALQFVLKDLENHLVEVLKDNFDTDWLVQKTEGLARKGLMHEDEFYALIGREYPGGACGGSCSSCGCDGGSAEIDDFPALARLFENALTPESKAKRKWLETPVGKSGKTGQQHLEDSIQVLDESVTRHWVPTVMEEGSRGCAEKLIGPET